MSVKDWDCSLRPREKALAKGLSCLSDGELLALVLRNGTRDKDVISLANQLLRQCGGLGGLMGKSVGEITQLEGIGSAKALAILAAGELAERASYQKLAQQDVIDRPEKLTQWLMRYIGRKEQEYFIVVFLDNQNRVKGYQPLYKGAANMVSINANELFTSAIRAGAKGLIVAHNHPSGKCTPSLADDQTTRELAEAGALMNIPLRDHIVVGQCDYYSYRQNGRMALFP